MINEKLKQMEGVVKDIQLHLSLWNRKMESSDLFTNLDELLKLHANVSNLIDDIIKIEFPKGLRAEYEKRKGERK